MFPLNINNHNTPAIAGAILRIFLMAKPENYINLGRPQNMAGILAECERINREGVTRRESVGDYNGGILFHGMASEFALCEEFARTGVECKRAPAQTKGYDLTIGESRIEVKAIKRYQEPIPLETDDVFLDYEKPIDWNFIIFTSASFGMMYNYDCLLYTSPSPRDS